MAKTFAIASDVVTGMTAVGTVKDFTKTTNGTAVYGVDANGEPDASSVHRDPTTASSTLELSGTMPVAASTEITIDSDVYHITSAAESQTAGEVTTAALELSEKI